MTRQQLAARLQGLSRDEKIAELRPLIGRFDVAERFMLLHELGIYHHPESLSGDASTFAETAALRAALPDLLARRKVRSLLDLPCGDFHWMAEVDLAGVSYLGVDVVPELIASNQRLYGGAGRSFALLDATRDPLPRADLVLCRDLLIHLSLADIRRVLAAIVASASRLLLVSHFADRASNEEIESGDFRPVNLCAPPFLLPPPAQVISEASRLAGGAFPDRGMALWQIADLAAVLARGDAPAAG